MFRNNLKIILRKLLRERMYSLVNLLGLTIGLCAFLLITLYVRDEFSFDQFHSQKEHTFRVISNSEDFDYRSSIACDYVELVAKEAPQIEAYSRILSINDEVLLESTAKKLYATQAYIVDKNFFEFFDFSLLSGSNKRALYQPAAAVITKAMAAKLFGAQNPLGKELKVNKERSVIIAGVAEMPPTNSLIQFEMLIAEQGDMKNRFEEQHWLRSLITYVRLGDAEQEQYVTSQFNKLKDKPVYNFFLKNTEYELLPLTEQRLTTLYDDDLFAKNDSRFVLMFMGIGIVILLLATINYINLTTAQSLKRSKEVGLRKVIGASRNQLIFYQLLESIVLTTLAFLLAFGLAERLLPVFNEVIGKSIELNYWSLEFVLAVPIMGLTLGIIAGIYPALYLGRFKALRLVNKQLTSTSGGGRTMRRTLVLIQFVAASVLLLVTLVMQSQLRYLDNKDLGFDKSELVSIPLFEQPNFSVDVFKSELQRMPGVQTVSATRWQLGRNSTSSAFSNQHEEGKGAENTRVEYVRADEDYLNTLGLRLTDFIPGLKERGLQKGEVVVSQKLVDKFSWNKGPIGRKVYNWNNEAKTVVGVVEDYHSRDFNTEILPTMIMAEVEELPYDYLLFKVTASSAESTLADIRGLYEESLQRPFQYHYLEEQAREFYRSEQGQMKLFAVFAGLAVFIAMIGLLALTLYMTEQRQKEVSIRKVLGASLKQLILLLNKEYTVICIVAFTLAIPVVVYAMRGWLQEFEYRVELGAGLFILALIGFVVLNLFITSIYTARVSRANPADTLRQD